MGFHTQVIAAATIFTGLVSAAAIPDKQIQARGSDMSPCANGPWVGPFAIGGDSGSEWCETKWDQQGTHDIITQIDVYAVDGTGINGIKFTFSGLGRNGVDSAQLHGTDTDDNEAITPKTLTLESGELITRCLLYGDGTGARLGYMHIETTGGKSGDQTFEVGWKNDGTDENEIDVGSGLLIGAYGAEGDSIDPLAFLFLASEIKHISVTDVTYDDSDLAHIGDDDIHELALLDNTMGNDKDSTDSITVIGKVSQKRTETSTFSMSISTTFGASFSVEFGAEPLGVGAKATATASWEISAEVTTSQEVTNEITLEHSVSDTVRPGHGVHCTITAFKGDRTFGYTSTVTINLKDGTKISFPQRGSLHVTAYSMVTGKCEPEDNPENWDSTQDNPPDGLTVHHNGKSGD